MLFFPTCFSGGEFQMKHFDNFFKYEFAKSCSYLESGVFLKTRRGFCLKNALSLAMPVLILCYERMTWETPGYELWQWSSRLAPNPLRWLEDQKLWTLVPLPCTLVTIATAGGAIGVNYVSKPRGNITGYLNKGGPVSQHFLGLLSLV